MFNHFDNSRGPSTHDGTQYPRWRTVFIALVFALTIGSVSQTTPAQAGLLAATEVGYFMLANKERPGQVCVGELVLINVLVYRYEQIDGVAQAPDTLTGVRVSGIVNNADIGQLSPPENTTIWASSIYPGAADFVFTAEKHGNTTITFYAYVATPGWFRSTYGGSVVTVSAEVDVDVIPCQYKVKAALSFNPGIYNIDVISDNALMVRDEAGTFTGHSTMHWVYSNFSIPCSVSAADNSVDLTGQLDDGGGQFVATATFGPVMVSGCGGSEQAAVNPLTFSVASFGGVSIQTVHATNISGLAHIVVVPEEGTAVSFNPGDHEASWDDFSSLFGAPLALR